MVFSEQAEEMLEMLWIKLEEEKQEAVSRADLETAAPGATAELDMLLAEGCVNAVPGGFRLTEIGRPEAENVVRRHRLAERLLVDVLDGWNEESGEDTACKFEHLLDRGLDDRICSLLGHPKVCPHGKPIPPGKCCSEMRETPSKVVSPLSRLLPGQQGKVAYLATHKPEELKKLASLGVLPGTPLKVIQVFPAYLFQAGQTQFAVDIEVAESIYVRLSDAPAEENGSTGRNRRKGWGWGRR